VNLSAPASTVEEERKKALFKPTQSCEPELLVATLFFRTTGSHLRVRFQSRGETSTRGKRSLELTISTALVACHRYQQKQHPVECNDDIVLGGFLVLSFFLV
jgi:hypothetical protein